MRDERLKSVPPEVWAKMSPEDRERSVFDYFEAQDARDGAGQLAAMEAGADRGRRIAAGEITPEQADQEIDDDIARIGSISDDERNALPPKERHAAMDRALGRDLDPASSDTTECQARTLKSGVASAE
jgi:hypothetical protein